MDKRKRVRFGCTLAPDVMDLLERMADEPGMTRTTTLERLVREEAERTGMDESAHRNGDPRAKDPPVADMIERQRQANEQRKAKPFQSYPKPGKK